VKEKFRTGGAGIGAVASSDDLNRPGIASHPFDQEMNPCHQRQPPRH